MNQQKGFSGLLVIAGKTRFQIHSILWRTPTILIVLAVLAPMFWVLFDDHFMERHPGLAHLMPSHQHAHVYESPKNHRHGPDSSQVQRGAYFSDDRVMSANLWHIDTLLDDIRAVRRFTSVRQFLLEDSPLPQGLLLPPNTPPPIT